MSVSFDLALPFVEYDSIATLGSLLINSLKEFPDALAMSAKASAVGFSFIPLSENINMPSSPKFLSGQSITKNDEIVLISPAPLIILNTGLNVSDVEWLAPETYPSASPSLTIIVAKYLEFVFINSSASSKVIPLSLRNLYNSSI